MADRTPRRRRVLRIFLVLLTFLLILGVWVTQQFPGLTRGPQTSVDILQGMFEMPFKMIADPAQYVFKRAERGAVIVFIKSCDLDNDVETRLVASLRGDRFRHETFPFLLHLFDLYGARLDAEEAALEELLYSEPPPEKSSTRPGISDLLKHSKSLRGHAAIALRLYDGIFLRVPLDGKTPRERPLEALGPEGVEHLEKILLDAIAQLIPQSDGALNDDVEESDYLAEIRNTLDDPVRFTAFAGFFVSYIRDVSNSWLEAFVRRAQRAERRREWVLDRISANRYYEIADSALARSRRKLVLHVTVDGLQGKLLEGLAQLSSGNSSGSGARYIQHLVAMHQREPLDSNGRDEGLPPGLGDDILALAKKAQDRPDYLENFKKYVYAPNAPSARVNVASADTPTISVRNLPIIYSGHTVSGPFGTGIPNFSYLDRETGRGWYFWGSDVVHMQRIFANLEDQIPGGKKRPEGPGARTLFERLKSYNTLSCMASVDLGALEKVSAEIGVAVGEIERNFIEKVIILQLRERAEMEIELNERRRWLIEHRNLSHSFLGSLFFEAMTLKTFREYAGYIADHDDKGIPDYTLWYNPWPDHFAHYDGPYSDAIVGFKGEYDRFDFYLGKILSIYSSLKTVATSESYLDRTLVGVVSDHGLVYTPKLVSIDQLLFDALNVNYQKLSADEGGLPVIHGSDDSTPTRGYDAVVGSTAGGSYIIDLFPPEGVRGDESAWKHHPGYHELRDHEISSGRVDWIKEIGTRLRGVVDVAVMREYGPELGGGWPQRTESVVRVVSPERGEARIHRLRSADGRRYRYEILGDRDPLQLVDSVRDFLLPEGASIEEARAELKRCIESEQGCTESEWLRALSPTTRPDAVYQFSHLYDTARAGTINLFPVRHVGMNSTVAGRHAGESFGEKNATALFFGAGLERGTIQAARNGSVPVTLYHWFVGDDVFRDANAEPHGVAPVDQFGFPSLLDDLRFRATP